MKMRKYETVDEYLNNFSGDTRKKLDSLRKLSKKLAPVAEERIAYGIPTYTWHGNLFHFAGYETHIGFYPGSMPISELKDELMSYKTSKGTVQFPLDKPLPMDLIKKMMLLCVEKNSNKSKSKKN